MFQNNKPNLHDGSIAQATRNMEMISNNLVLKIYNVEITVVTS